LRASIVLMSCIKDFAPDADSAPGTRRQQNRLDGDRGIMRLNLIVTPNKGCVGRI
jgi:hypothetical protein